MGGISHQESLYQMMFGSPQDPDESLGAFMYRLTPEGISDCCYTGAYKSGYKELHPSLAAFMKCPVPNGRATRANLDALTQSHEALQGFWLEARRWRKNRMVDNGLREHEADKRVQCLAFSGNATHAKLIASERHSLLAAIEAREKVASARQGQAAKEAKQANDPHTVWGISEPETLPGSGPKSKEKTRPTTQADKAHEVGHDDNINALSTAAKTLTIAPKVEVSKDSMRLLTRMYASMDDTKANKGSVKWDDLVAALIDSGFQVTPNGGSAVTFKDTGGRGSIVFHRPHPDPPLDPIMLRSIGKRLAKWFGWEKESFVERGKV
ncbi:hypothetical protein DOTSEDRAFT_22049 [Dothistroma septosporum NZE10]|uniref:Type II toxin-antitoxin system HicA family toxin n=1 Tax=Dothistroma septosporum (strain NZE10 / CBS 128990) TaxID=675120 RepID=N1PR54_DOTSN|nr:hypothetical protein DOTSEDRAFT_22049 [Dothistroma septosporum NZE10]